MSSVGVREGCVVSPWLFNIFMDGYEVNQAKSGKRWCKNEAEWSGLVGGLPACILVL